MTRPGVSAGFVTHSSSQGQFYTLTRTAENEFPHEEEKLGPHLQLKTSVFSQNKLISGPKLKALSDLQCEYNSLGALVQEIWSQ